MRVGDDPHSAYRAEQCDLRCSVEEAQADDEEAQPGRQRGVAGGLEDRRVGVREERERGGRGVGPEVLHSAQHTELGSSVDLCGDVEIVQGEQQSGAGQLGKHARDPTGGIEPAAVTAEEKKKQ